MRLEAMGPPDAGDRGVADAERVCHCAGAPPGRPRGGLGRRGDDGLHRGRGDRRAAAPPWGVLLQRGETPGPKSLRHRSTVGRDVPRRRAI